MTIRVAIVDDHVCFATGVRLILEHRTDDIQVIGVGHSVADAILNVIPSAPDVVLMDLNLPDGSGLDAARRLRDEIPDVKIVILTAADDPYSVAAAMETGVHGYLVKTDDEMQIIDGIRTAFTGGLVFDARARDAFVRWSLNPVKLEASETEILRLVAAGFDNKTVAASIAVSVSTLKRTLQSIAKKLNAQNRVEAAVSAARNGLI